jgi:hypothetical protein
MYPSRAQKDSRFYLQKESYIKSVVSACPVEDYRLSEKKIWNDVQYEGDKFNTLLTAV